MDVDDDFADAEGAQAGETYFKESATREFDQGFGAILRQRLQARAEPGRKNHSFHRGAFIAGLSSCRHSADRGDSGGLHLPIFSNCRWRTATSTPFFARKRLASCSARNTERCWPPVHPKETIRFLNPRAL